MYIYLSNIPQYVPERPTKVTAAVIGGSSLSGGIGTIPGAVLGAVVMQSLRSGMVMLRVDSPTQDIVVGTVLVAAVGLDTFLRRRST